MEKDPLFGTWNPNPYALKRGDECYAVYVPALRPGSGLLDGVHDAIQYGTVETSYDDMPVGGRDDAVNFLPKHPFPGTKVTDAMYRLSDWAMFPDMAGARQFQSALAEKAIRAHESEIARLRVCLIQGESSVAP